MRRRFVVRPALSGLGICQLPVNAAMFVARALLLATLLTLPLRSAAAQFVEEVAVIRDGVRFLVRPSVTINTTPGGVVQVQLTQIHARIDESYGIVVDGVKEPYTAWNRGLVSGFSAIRVISLSLGITFDGVQGCPGRVGYATWREGGQETLACNSGSRARLTGFTVNGLSTSGLLELQAEVRRRRAADRREAEARARQAREDSIARARQAAAASPSTVQAAQPPTAGRTPSAMAGSAAAPTAAPASSATSASSMSQEEKQRQAEAAREAAAAQAALDQITRDNAAAQQRLDAATDELAGSVVAVAQIFAQNSRDKQAREARQAAANAAAYQRRVAEYSARIAARYAANLSSRTCSLSDLTVARIGTVLTDSLTMQSCRTTDGRAMAWVQVVNTTPRHVRVTASGASEFGGLAIAQAPASEWANGSSAGKSKATDFFLAPGAPAHRMMVWTNQRGEIGRYSVNVREWTRSAIDDAVWFTGLDVFSGANTIGEYEESLFGGRFEGGLHVGNGILLAGHLGMEGSSYDGAANYNFGFNAQYILGNDNQRFRPFLRLDPWTAVYGTTTYGFNNEVGYQGFTYGFGAGVLFFPSLRSNDIAITLEWGTTMGSMFDDNTNDQDYSQSGFRLGYRAFGYGMPR